MEKVAIISDIHSNIYALKAVVEDAEKKGYDTFINLGDIFYGPIAPRKTYEYLITKKIITISGNQDRQILEDNLLSEIKNPTMEFVINDLGAEPLEWIKSLPFDKQINQDIYAFHGTPTDDLVYLLEDINSGNPIVRTDKEIIKLLNGASSKIIICGHTHTPRYVELSTGQIVINPGSVGLQAYEDNEPVKHTMQNYSPKASYATLEKISDNWSVSFHRVAYDYQSAVKDANLRNRKDWAYFLTTGRCKAV